MKKDLSGVRAKMAARDERRKGPRNSSPTGQRIACPAYPKARRPKVPKPQPGPVGAPYSRSPEPKGPTEREPELNRRTGKPHEHKGEIARRTRQRTAREGRGA